MSSSLARLAFGLSLSVSIGALAVAACTRTTDRVLEPVGGGDASTNSPELSDAGATPIGPIAPLVPPEDFRLVRSPEFGSPILREAVPMPEATGGTGASGGLGMGGSDRRPVSSSSGGAHF